MLLQAEIIDRIAVTVGSQVITASDLERELRVAAFLNGQPPDFSGESKRRTADLLVRQRLVKREVELARYPTPDPSEVEPVLKAFKQEHYPAPGQWEKALAQAGLTEKELRDHILRQLTLLRFIDVRFRPAVQIADEDVAAYFRKAIEPAARAATGGQPVSLDDYRDRIVEILTERQIDKDLDQWIREAVKRTAVEYRPEVFQ